RSSSIFTKIMNTAPNTVDPVTVCSSDKNNIKLETNS
ncbi:prepilin-type cleavage/methylation domain-containing protein, partial [Escherichia coli]